MTANIAALQGWVKSIDPKSGRAFYANHVTRKTQWDPPEGWVEEPVNSLPPSLSLNSGTTAGSNDDDDDDEDDEPLPSNWEMMTDPSTGKHFYVDHKRKITQWIRPKAPKAATPVISHAPAAAATTTSAALARILQSSSGDNPYSAYGNFSPDSRSYHQEASYFQPTQSGVQDVDFSDALPALDFSVKKVMDKYRLECPSCDGLFTLSKRRHHCRLCGDIFCDSCSNHRVELPLPGAEYEKPVRVCDLCFKDVEKGNFFSMRRYITPLLLYDPSTGSDDDEMGAATPSNVNAALSGLTQDLNQIIQSAEGFEEKVTIPVETLVSSIAKHLSSKANTADRCVHALATLLSLGSMVGKHDFAHAVYLLGKEEVLNQILTILERSGSDRKTLFVQEQAARAMFFLTEPQVITSLVQKQGSNSSSADDSEEPGSIDCLDILKTLKSMLDHSSMSKNLHLQRWAAATVRNLIAEDQRRACMAINDTAGRLASGESAGKLGYESFLGQLVSTGGVIILCSLVGSDDSDTRAHATAALGGILASTRAIDESMAALYELSGGSIGSTQKKDGDIVRAISAGGGCSSSVSQLLLSADNSVARMGCDFLASLVLPLLIDPQGCVTLDRKYDCRSDSSGLGACREAALEIATSSCLPALLSIVRDTGRATRPIELRKVAMETLAAAVNGIGEMGKSWSGGKYEEGMSNNGAPSSITQAVSALSEERVTDIAMGVLKSSSTQSLGSNHDTTVSRIRESAGIILGALSSCSAEAIMELHGQDVLPTLIVSSSDASMTAPSTLRGDSAPRCVGLLETAASVMMFNWLHPSGASSSLLDNLIETLDVGVITILFEVLTTSIEWDSRDKSSGGMKSQAAACRVACCLFGIAITSDSSIGMQRLMDGCDASQPRKSKHSKGPRNIMEAVLTVLQTALNHAHKMLVGNSTKTLHYQAALLDLVESALLAAGSMCGSSGAPGGVNDVISSESESITVDDDRFKTRCSEVCRVACEVVVRSGRTGQALLPSMLVGGFGEGVVAASLRLALAITHNGTEEQHSKLALCGILVPISDILRAALSKGELYNFSSALALVRFCGPYVSAGSDGGVQSVKSAIAVATNVLTLPINPASSQQQIKTQEALKAQCIQALESLSRNATLWKAISTVALPSIVQYLNAITPAEARNPEKSETYCSALRAVLQIVQVPSNVVSAAQAGLATSVGTLLEKTKVHPTAMGNKSTMEMQYHAISVLHVLIMNMEARRFCSMQDLKLLAPICAAIEAATGDGADTTDKRDADLTVMCLELFHALLGDIKSPSAPRQLASVFTHTVVNRPDFVRRLSSTLLAQTAMKLRKHDEDELSFYDIPDHFGPPLVFVDSPCCGYKNTHEAAGGILFSVCVLSSMHESNDENDVWNVIFKTNSATAPDTDELRNGITFCAQFLSLLEKNYGPFDDKTNPANEIEKSLLSYKLLETLKGLLSSVPTHVMSGWHDFDPYTISALVEYNVPSMCLSFCKDQVLLPLAFGTLSMLTDSIPDEVLDLFVAGKSELLLLFDLLNLQECHDGSTDVSEIHQFCAATLEKLSENSVLKDAVIRHGVRPSAIAGLAAACLRDQSHTKGEDLTSNSLSSGLMRCLVDLCVDGTKSVVISSVEAESIARSLGKKICHMVISRFIERAKLKRYEIDEDEDVLHAPDIAMLCAISQHENGLKELRAIGGFHALALVAGEGQLMALMALEKGCADDANLLLEADTYSSLMNLFSEEREEKEWFHDPKTRHQVETVAMMLLGKLCSGSRMGRKAVLMAPTLPTCVHRALEVARSHAVPSDVSTSTDKIDTNITAPSAAAAEVDNQTDEDEKTPEAEQETDNVDVVNNDSAPIPSEEVPPTQHATPPPKEDMVVASFAFLSSIVAHETQLRKTLLGDEVFVSSCAEIIKNSKPLIVLEAVRLLSFLVPFVSSQDVLSTTKILELMQSVLDMEIDIDNGGKGENGVDSYCVHSHAVNGIQRLYGAIPAVDIPTIGKSISARYTKLIRNSAVQRQTNQSSRNLSGGGNLAFLITTFLLRALSAEPTVFNKATVVCLANTVQWRMDPKSTIPDQDKVHWDAAVSQSLQILSLIFAASKTSISACDISLEDVKGATLMIAKPGKAPRKAIDVVSAITHLAKSGESTTKVCAELLLEQILE